MFLSRSGTRGNDQPFPCDLQLLAGKLDYNDAGTPQARIVGGTARSLSLNDNHLVTCRKMAEIMRSLCTVHCLLFIAIQTLKFSGRGTRSWLEKELAI